MRPSPVVLAQLSCGYWGPNLLRNFSALPGCDKPLRLEAEHFLGCIRTGKEPATGINHAREVVSILERADAAHAGHSR